jgi:predicted metal-dependent phosphoesterase TrpH
MKKLKADLHLHTNDDPFENIRYSAKDLIDVASQREFDVLSITNHEMVTYSKELEEYALSRGILLIPGAEPIVQGKDILIYNLLAYEPGKIKTFEDLKRYKGDDTLIVAPHPFFPSPRSLLSLFHEAAPALDGLEYCHHYTRRVNFNRKAEQKSKELNLPLIGSSDTHLLSQFGTNYSLIESEKEVNAVIQAIKEKKVEVVTRPLDFLHTVKVWTDLFRQTPAETVIVLTWMLFYLLFRLELNGILTSSVFSRPYASPSQPSPRDQGKPSSP